jgi:S-formylglutathione hydrolase FrmB
MSGSGRWTLNGVIVRSVLASDHLSGNLLGDPSDRELFVYLPPGYESSETRYPTAYLLHEMGKGAAGLIEPSTEGRRWSPPLVDVLDPVFGRMGVAPMIVVVPDGATRYGHSQWVDSPVCGRYEQYVVSDVVDYVDRHFRTDAREDRRGVLGFSSGGAGAWHLAARNPHVFSAMAMLSGDSLFELSLKPMLYRYLDSIWPEAPDGPAEGNDISFTVHSYASCYSPNPSKPPYFVDLPISHPSGELNEDAWASWLTFDPVESVDRYMENLSRLRGVMLDVGVSDDFNIHWGHRLLSHRLRSAGIVHEVRENSGNHGGRSLERIQMALSWMSRVLDD